MSPSGTALAWVERIVGSPVVRVEGLRNGDAPWLIGFGGVVPDVVLRVGAGAEALTTEAAALRVAEGGGVAAPRLLGVDLGLSGLVMSAVAGSSRVGEVPGERRWWSLGEAVAGVGLAPLPEIHGLRRRSRPIETDADGGARSPLQVEAARVLARVGPVDDVLVLAHGDVWLGNTLWGEDESFLGFVDWDCAGVAPAGLDLGSARLDAVTSGGFGMQDAVVDGWSAGAGRAPRDLAYWDAVAAVHTPADMTDWLPVLHDQGWSDLDPATLTARRDVFLRAALDELV